MCGRWKVYTRKRRMSDREEKKRRQREGEKERGQPPVCNVDGQMEG